MENRKVIITSGFFNPLHVGHLNLLRESKKLGNFLVVIINNDKQVRLKGSIPFMDESERLAIIKELKHVDAVFLSVDEDGIPIPKSLENVAKLYPGELFFAKGGDRNFDNLPKEEKKVCRELNIKVLSGVGGDKVQSSSWLLNHVNQHNQHNTL